MPRHDYKLDARTRTKALEAGQWQTSDGTFVSLYKMDGSHLVNAYLKALVTDEPKAIAEMLGREVLRRGLVDYAYRVAQGRAR